MKDLIQWEGDYIIVARVMGEFDTPEDWRNRPLQPTDRISKTLDDSPEFYVMQIHTTGEIFGKYIHS